VVKGKGVILFGRDGTIDAPAGPLGVTLAFLSDLHEQIELQLARTADPAARTVLDDVRLRIISAGLTISLLGAQKGPEAQVIMPSTKQ
jgi:hypothetical protein